VGHWQPLNRIETTESEMFCRQCGATLGWLLESNQSPVEIRAAWKQLIQREDSNGARRK
jgi:hypothetical protein